MQRNQASPHVRKAVEAKKAAQAATEEFETTPELEPGESIDSATGEPEATVTDVPEPSNTGNQGAEPEESNAVATE